MDNKRFLAAIAISLIILVAWQYFIEGPRLARQQALLEQQQTAEATQQQNQQPAEQVPVQPTQQAGAQVAAGTLAPSIVSREEALAQSPRVAVENSQIKGSIALRGARIDDLVLKNYRETVDPKSPSITLFSPFATEHAYYADFGWTGPAGVKSPDVETLWQADKQTLSPGNPVTLTWDNGQGLVFTRKISIDDNFMFTIADQLTNAGQQAVSLVPYARVVRYGTPTGASQTYVLHEGLIGVMDGKLNEFSYGSVKENGVDGGAVETLNSTGGWVGITDKYWLAAPIAPSAEPITSHFFYVPQADFYQSDYAGAARQLAPGQNASIEQKLFAGAKVVRLLSHYRDEYGIPLFDRAVDFGWFFFLTKPLFYLLDNIFHIVGNFGISILILTVIVKLAMFPLANKAYKSMSRMKLLAPQMQELKVQCGDDRARLNQEMMALYKREKVNPASGCLPLFVQIPVFYALYKVLYVTIEMRHTPFFGWIKDLSAPDPTSIMNLFGLLPWDTHHIAAVPVIGGILAILSIGVWPIVMGVTMWVQQKLNPAPPDPVQAKIFAMLPIMFTFMLGHFAAGLVIYWAWNNLLSIAQQKVIMSRMEAEKAKAKA